ncbi:MAG: hypothetical protein EBQ94_05165 [Flavobacteriales bacterium]|nr:hypothetical protein [Crocinitomicaceae bacterium]NBX79759.1 hypothetical protein [Flavobacteriales bacterium]
MMRILTIIILLFLTTQTFGQENKKISKNRTDEISQKIAEINTLLKYYGTLSPFSDNEKRFELIDSISNNITTRLLQILNDNRIINYPIETLFNQDEISISKSNDNKIFFFSIDEKTGGSYRTSITFIHYRLSNGNVKADYFGEMTYGQVFLLDSLNQKYFVIGSVQTCNTCNSSSAISIKLDTNIYQTDLIAQYDGRYPDLKVFEYDSLEKVFSFEYNAADNDDSLYGGDNENLGLQHKFKSKYKFINGTFLEIEKCELWDQKK